MALSFNAQAGTGTGVHDGYSGRYRGGDGGKTLTIQPPADDPASRLGRNAGHRATRSLLVTPGQGRSPLPPLDSDALNPGSLRRTEGHRRRCSTDRECTKRIMVLPMMACWIAFPDMAVSCSRPVGGNPLASGPGSFAWRS